MLGQRAGVDADAQRRAALLGQRDDLGDLLGAADVARVQAHAVRAGLDRLQRERVVEVDVGDDRDRRLARRSSSAPRRPARAARRTRTMSAPASATRADLVHRRRQVGGLGLGHRLHGDGRAAADGHAADVDLALRGHAVTVISTTPWPRIPGRLRTARAGRARAARLARWRPAPAAAATPRFFAADRRCGRGMRVLDVGCGRSACARWSRVSTSPASTSPPAPTTPGRSCRPTPPRACPSPTATSTSSTARA